MQPTKNPPASFSGRVPIPGMLHDALETQPADGKQTTGTILASGPLASMGTTESLESTPTQSLQSELETNGGSYAPQLPPAEPPRKNKFLSAYRSHKRSMVLTIVAAALLLGGGVTALIHSRNTSDKSSGDIKQATLQSPANRLLTVNSKLQVEQNTDILGNLTVKGTVTLGQGLSVVGNGSFSGDVTAANFTTSGLQVTGSANFAGALNVSSLNVSTIAVSGNGNFGGDVNVAGTLQGNLLDGNSYAVNGVAGATVVCTGGDVFANATVQGGIVVGGNCTTVATGGGTTDLQTAYNNSTSPEITLNSTNGALTLRDAVVGLGGNLLEVQSNNGSTDYFAVSASGTSVGGALDVLGTINLSQGSTISDSPSGIVFSFGGRNYVLPASGGANQTICTSAVTCATGSGSAVLLGTGTVQDNGSGNSAIFINNSAGGNLLQLQSGGSDVLVVDNSGNLTATSLIGAGSGITSLNATNISSGTLSNARLSASVTLQGNTFNGASQLVLLNGTGGLPALNASLLTALNASNVSSGTLNDARLSTNVALFSAAANFLNTLQHNGNNVCDTSGNCAGVGGGVTTTGGTTGTLPVFTGAQSLGDSLISQSGGNVTVGGGLSATSVSGSGNGLTNLNASNVSSGTLSDTRLSANVTLQGNTFNGVNQLVQLNGTGGLPALNASLLTNLNATNVASGTLADARLSANVTLQGNTFNGINQLVQLNGTGGLPALNGSLLTSLNATNISSGTLSDSRLSANVALLNAAANFTNTLQHNGNNVCDTSGNCAAAGSAGGDLTGSYPNPTIAKLQGVPFSITSLTSGQMLQYNGTNWVNQTIGGDVTIDNAGVVTIGNAKVTNAKLLNSSLTVTAGTGLSGGGSVSLGAATTLNLANTTVTAGSYGDASHVATFTVDAQGRLTAASSALIAIDANQVTSGTLTVARGGTGQGSYTDGQLLIGNSSGNTLTKATLTAGAGVTITNGNGSITIAAPGAGSCAGCANTSLSNLNSVALNTDLLPGAAAGVNLGSGTLPFGQLYLAGTSVTPATNNFLITGASTGGLRTITLPDASGTVAVSASGYLSLNSTTGALTFVGPLAVADGGTGSGTAAGARSNLGAAASGSNSDITALNTVSTITNSGAITVGNTGQKLTLQGDNTSVFKATAGGFSTTVGFASPTANVNYNFATAAAGTYNICTTAGNCTGAGGGVTTPGGTTNTLPIFTGSQTLGDSIISQDVGATTVTIAGTLAVNTLTPTAALTVGNTGQNLTLQGAVVNLKSTNGGITNSLTFATPSGSNKTITVPNANGTVAVSATGPLALDAAGNLTCPTCLTSGGGGGTAGVSSVDTMTGAITVQGTANQVIVTDGTGTITLSLPQDINTTSAPTFAGLTVNGATSTVGLVNSGSTLLSASSISDLPTGGNIGTAAATVDSKTTFNVNQTTASQALTLPSPTITTAGRVVFVNNVGSTSFTMYNATIPIGEGRSFMWNGSAWTLVDNVRAGTGLTQTGNTINSAAATSVSNDTNLQGSISGNVLTLSWAGQLSVARGGTGAGSFTTNGILFGNNTGALQVTAAAANSVLVTNGSNVPSLSQTLPTVVQGNITSTGALAAGSIASGFGTISTGNNITTTTTLQGGAVISTSSVTSGTAAVAGALILHEGSNHPVTITSAVQGNAVALSVPVDANVTDTFCLQSLANCAGTAYISALGAIDGAGSTNANGATVSSGTLYLNSASASFGGVVTTSTQTFAGVKTFSSQVVLSNGAQVASQKTIDFVGGTTAQRPASPTAGQLFFDTSINQLVQYNGSKWVSDHSSSTKIVAASNSSQAAKDAADYVATGSGDQATINTALTAAAGGTVYLLEGTYTTSATIAVPNNTTLMGAGPGTIITIPNSANTSYSMITNSDTTTGTNVVVRDLTLDGNTSNQASGSMSGINFTGMGGGSGASARNGTKITGMIVRNFSLSGIALKGANAVVTGNTVINSLRGMLLNTLVYSTISNNNFQGNGTGVGLQLTSTNNTVIGNTVQGSTGNGIDLTTSSGGNTITGNTLAGGGNKGIEVLTTNNTISGNTSQANTGAGIYLSSATGSTVTGNTILGNSAQGIIAFASSLTISGNYISSNTLEGINLNGATNGSVTGNTIISSGNNGIYLIGGSANVISGNKVHDSSGATANDGIYATSSNQNTITNNDITDTSCTTTCYAINIPGSGSAKTYLSNNRFTGDGTNPASINDAGTGTVYANQARTEDGGQLTVRTANNSTAFQVQNASGDGIFTVDTSSSAVLLGKVGASGIAGQLAFADGSSNFSASLKTAVQGNNVVVSLPADTNVTDTICLQTLANCIGTAYISALGAIDGAGSPNANGATVSSGTLYLNSASASFGGVVTTGSQTLAGNKTLTGATILQGNVTVGSTSTNGAVKFLDGTADGFTGTIQLAGAIGSNQTYSLPTTGGTFCLSTNNCNYQTAGSYETTSGTDFIRNQTSQQTANFNIVSGAAGNIAALIQGAGSATVPVAVIEGGATPGAAADLLQLQNSSGNTLATFNNNGDLIIGGTNSAASTKALQVLTTGGDSLFSVDTSSNTVLIGKAGVINSSLRLSNSANSNLSILRVNAPTGSGNASYFLPAIAGGASDTFCLQTLSNCTAIGSAGGDLTGTYPNPTIAKLQGTTVTVSSLASNDVLLYNGSAWVNGHITNSNLTSGSYGNITAVGTLTGLTVSGASTLQGNATFGSTSTNGAVKFLDGTADGFTGTIQLAGAIGSNQIYNLPTTGGTFCLQSSSACGFTTGSGAAVTTLGAIDGSGSANANGATISANTLYLNSASASFGGVVNATTQTFAGDKTFTGNTTVNVVSSTAFQIQNSGSSFLTADSSNQIITTKDLVVGSGSTGHLFSDSFESGTGNLWPNPPTVNTTHARSGKYAAQVTNGFDSATLSQTHTPFYIRAYIYPTSRPSANANIFTVFNTSTGIGPTELSLYQAATTGNICVYHATGTPGFNCSSTPLTLNTWNKVEFLVNVNTSTGSETATVNGTTAVSWTSINTGSAGIDQFYLGDYNSAVFTFWADDVVADTSAQGDGASLSVTDSLYAAGSTVLSGPVLLHNGFDSTNAFQVQNAAGNSLLNVDTQNANVTVANAGLAGTVQIGNTTGAVAQTINIGNNATASSTSTVTIGNLRGSSTTTIQAGTGNINLNVNQAGAGVVVKTLTNNSATAFQVQNSAGVTVLQTDTTITQASNLVTNPDFEVNATGWAATGTGASATQTNTAANIYRGNGAYDVTLGTSGATGAQVSGTGLSGSALTPGTYTLSFYAKGGAALSGLAVSFTGGTITQACTLNSTSVVTTGFTRYYCTFIFTTTNVTAIKITSTTLSQHLYLDDVQVVSGSNFLPQYTGAIRLDGAVTDPSLFKNTNDSTTAFQIQNAAGTSSLLVADTLNSRVGINLGASATATADLSFGTGTDRTINIIQATSGNNGNNLSLQAGSGNGTNKNGGNLVLSGGNSTGTGTPGAVVVKPQTDTSASFQIQNAAGTTSILSAGTTDALATPGTPTVTPGATNNSKTWGYKVVAVTASGTTAASAQGTTTGGAGATTLGSGGAAETISWSAVTGATSYKVYRTSIAAGGSPITTGVIGTTTNTSFTDTGQAADGSTEPSADTTFDSTLQVASPNRTYFIGVDNSDSSKFKISSNYANNSAVLGYNVAGSFPDSASAGTMDAYKYQYTGATGTVTSMSAFISTVAGSSSYQFAIYTDNAGSPGTLLASSGTGTLVANSWNTLPITASVTNSVNYWLVWNTNGTSSIMTETGTAGQNKFLAGTFGTWPSSFGTPGNSATKASIYATVAVTGATDSFAKNLLSLSDSGQLLLQNSTSAFQVQNAAGTSVFNVNSIDKVTTANDLVLSGGGSRLFSDGFESGNFNLWTPGETSAGTTNCSTSDVQASTTVSRTGKYSAKVCVTSGNAAYLKASVTANATMYARAYVYFATPSTPNGADRIITLSAGGADKLYVYRDANSGQLVTNTIAGNGPYFGTALPANQWHEIEVSATENGGNATYYVFLDGVLNITTSNTAQLGGTPFDLAEFGETTTATGRSETYYLDDIAVDTTNLAGVATSGTAGTSGGLVAQDSLHVGGTASFGSSVLIQPANNSSTAFQIQDASGTSILSVDTSSQTLTVKKLVVNTSLTVNGHIISGNTSGSTAIAAGAASNCSGSATVSVSGNDTAGTATITTSTGTCAAGVLGTITFGSSYGSAPRVILTPANNNATTIQYYTNSSTTTTFTIDTNNAAAISTTYKYNYHVIQ